MVNQNKVSAEQAPQTAAVEVLNTNTDATGPASTPAKKTKAAAPRAAAKKAAPRKAAATKPATKAAAKAVAKPAPEPVAVAPRQLARCAIPGVQTAIRRGAPWPFARSTDA